MGGGSRMFGLYVSKCYATIEEAAAARKELERMHWGIA
jgi:hypothetical protein